MDLAWREGVFVCEADGRQILLDVGSGRFSALSPATTRALKRARQEGEFTPEDRRALEPLIATGKLQARAALGGPALSALQPPISELEEQGDTRIFVGDLALAIVAQGLSRAVLKAFGATPLFRLFARFPPTSRESLPGGTQAAVVALARALARSDLLFSRLDRCLARSAALRLMSLWRGFDVSLVIGVRGEPFVAHSWAERDGVVLNDDMDVVRQFTPLAAF